MIETSLEERGQLRSGLSPIRAQPESVGRMVLRRFFRLRLAVAGLVTLLILALGALAAPFYRYDPEKISLLEKLEAPSLQHPLGTDDLGRDMLARVLHGG